MEYTIDANETLWRVTLSGTLSKRDLLELERLIMEMDQSSSVARHWLVDLRPLSTMDLDYRSVSKLARALGSRSLPHTERVVLLAGIPIQYGFARMFQMLSEQWHAQVEVFENEKDALNWLSNQTQ
jgi:hypothetical protein